MLEWSLGLPIIQGQEDLERMHVDRPPHQDYSFVEKGAEEVGWKQVDFVSEETKLDWHFIFILLNSIHNRI
jgi:hypothetical protein